MSQAKIGSEKWKSALMSSARKIGVGISENQADRLGIHAGEVIAANLKFNLTSITDPVEVMEKHVIDSLAVTRYIEKIDARIIDVGSGGGFPGIPVKIAMPETDVTLVDRSRKKVNFLNYIIRKLGLLNIRAIQARVEEMPGADVCGDGFDIAVSRAFASLRRMVEAVLPLIKPAGAVLAMKGSKVNAEIDELLALPVIAAGRQKSIHSDSIRLELHKYALPVLNLSRAVVIARFLRI